MRTRRVFVTGGGGAAAVAFLNAIQTSAVDVFMGDIDPHAAGLYLVPPHRRQLLPRGDDPDFSEALLAICRSHEIDVLVPTVDCELLPLAGRAADFERGGTRLLSAPASALRLCLDKWQLTKACAGAAAVPRTALLDAAFTSTNWPLPVIVKPRQGSGSRGVQLISSWSDLRGVPVDGSLIVQEYLPGEEYSVDVLVDPTSGQVVAAVPRARLKVDSGVAVAGRTVHDAGLETAACAIAEHLGLTFVGNIQLRRNQRGEPVLLEVNPRFPGTMSLTVASGVNMPRLALDAVLGHGLVGRRYPFRDVAVVRTWQDHYFPPEELLSPALRTVEVR
jgi:carbamoyl-phosphate synthase large subunit